MKTVRYGCCCLFLILLSVVAPLHAQLSITPAQTAAALVAKLAGSSGGGISVSNASLSCPSSSEGLFSNAAATSLGLDSGIVLTTGLAQTGSGSYGVNGPESANASYNNGAPGDPALNNLAGATTLNACALEFDLVPAGDVVSFQYVFASEEYNNSTCGPYNDAFAFFISGPGISGTQNIAQVPGTSIPVTVNSINSGVPGTLGTLSNCSAMGPGSPFTAYYINNAGGSALTYKGFTTVLTAQSGVTPCATYHLKMVIADAGNALYDSAVFLKAGSLATTEYHIRAAGADSAGDAVTKGCQPGAFVVSATAPKSVPQTIHYLISGNAVNGYDYAMVPDSVVMPANDTSVIIPVTGLPTPANGPKQLRIRLINPFTSCTGGVTPGDSALLNIYDTLSLQLLSKDTTICAGQQLPLNAAASALSTVYWTPAAGLSNDSALSITATPPATATYTVHASFEGCPDLIRSLTITVNEQPTINAGPDVSICVHTPLYLAASVAPANQQSVISYTSPGGQTHNGAVVDVADAQPADSGLYVFTAQASGCPAATDTVLVNAGSYIDPPVLASPVLLCQFAPPVMLSVSDSNLLWYAGPAGGAGNALPPTPSTTVLGSASYYVSRVSGACESGRATLVVTVEKCCADRLFLPGAFTPNADGRNDVWRVLKGPEAVVKSFAVYNRWGQEVYQSNGDEGWDGRINGAPADVGPYYYRIVLQCLGKDIVLQGDVMLVR